MKRSFLAMQLLLSSLLVLAQTALAQTSGHNYIVERVMCDARGTDTRETIHYYDGLGRPVETVATAASPSGGDIVAMQKWDGAGCVVRSWNTAPCGVGKGEFVAPSRFVDTARGFYDDTHPYTATAYEQSPLGRAVMQTGPGRAWHNGGRCTSTAYMLNDNSVDSLSCRIVKARDTRLATDTAVNVTIAEPYPTGTLQVSRTTDEEGFVTLVFTDKAGRTVLERHSTGGGKWADTYYIYDLCGRLTAVLPPAFSVDTAPQAFSSADNEAAARYCYFYLYDREGRCRAKKLPGCSWQLFVRDVTGNIVYSQDGMQRQSGEWAFTLRDVFGRDCVTGLCRGTFDVLGQTVPDFSLHAVRDRASCSLPGYRATSPQGMELHGARVLSVKYYDDYSFIGESMPVGGNAGEGKSSVVFPDSTFSYKPMPGYGNRYTASAKAMLTGECCAVLGAADGTFLATAHYYDTEGRVVQSCSSNVLGGHDTEWTAYDFTGNVMSLRAEHTPAGITEERSLTYDRHGRPLTETMSVNGGSAVTIAAHTYDETRRLASTCRADNKVLSTQYAYNVRSWPTAITGTLFSERLYYNDAPLNPRYDGCIAKADWQWSDNRGTARYSYDAAKRLTAATYGGKYSEDYSTQYAYDIMGNMTMLVRRGHHDDYTYSYLDILNCAYDGNRLMRVSDGMTAPTYKGSMQFSDRYSGDKEYAYDSDGGMTGDRNRGMAVAYNAIGLPQDIALPKGTIRYRYAADGQKVGAAYTMPLSAAASVQAMPVSATSLQAAGSASASSCDGTAQDREGQVFATRQSVRAISEYCGNLIYRDGKPYMLLFDGGYVSFAAGSEPQYVFYLRDHLGSNRMAVAADGTVVEQNHYYPYGALMDNSTLDGSQPFKYNGKELDRMLGLDLMDYGARWYDPVVPHWMTVDPLCEKDYGTSPYVFCKANPIMYLDNDGKRPKAMEAVWMAAYAYKDKKQGYYLDNLSTAGWHISNYDTSIQMNHTGTFQNGLQSVLFERKTDGKTEYAYAFAGTQLYSLRDMAEDALQVAGLSEQYETAIDNAKTLSDELEDKELTFVGHSLGGGEAAASSMATGRSAITFNPAAVSPATMLLNGLDKSGNITNYVAIGRKTGIGNLRIGGDVLNNFQKSKHWILPGKTIPVLMGFMPTHGIADFLNRNLPEAKKQ